MSPGTRTSLRLPALLSRWGAAGGGLVVASLVVVQASSAAFTGTTTSPNNTWASGSVTITSDQPGSTLFTETGLKPGSTGTKCLVVEYTGSLAAEVRLHAAISTSAPNASTALEDHMTVSIDRVNSDQADGGICGLNYGTSSPITVYTGGLTALTTSHSAFSNGAVTNPATTWTPNPATPSTLFSTYRITWTLPSNATDAAQNKRAKVTFTWEAQNT